jgi:hypothetical protein
MSKFTDSAQSKQIDQHEHNTDAAAKRVILRGQDIIDGEFYNIGAVDNGDGTHAIKTGESPLALRIDDTNDPILYVGKASPGSDDSLAVWQIAKLDTSSGLDRTWAGNAGFTQVWSDRESLTYN